MILDTSYSPPILQAHCQSPASPSKDQSFVKELAKPTQEKLLLKNFPTLKKNKKRNAQPDTDRQKSKQAMTLKPNTDNGLQGRMTEHQLPTGYWRKLGRTRLKFNLGNPIWLLYFNRRTQLRMPSLNANNETL